MNNGCCSNCQAKVKKKKKPKKIKDESDDETVKQEQKGSEKENPKTDSNMAKGVSENENPKTDSDKDKGFHEPADHHQKKKDVLTWQHSSTKKEKGHGNKSLNEKNGVNPPCYTARPMMYHGGPNPSNRWPMSAAPRGRYPAFSMPPMYGPYVRGGGPIQPYQSMYGGAHISPYPPMAAAAPPPYWQARPFMDANPMTRYTSYADNYSFCFI